MGGPLLCEKLPRHAYRRERFMPRLELFSTGVLRTGRGFWFRRRSKARSNSRRTAIVSTTATAPWSAAAIPACICLLQWQRKEPMCPCIERKRSTWYTAHRQGSHRCGGYTDRGTMNDLQRYHTDPLEASRITNEAGVQLLVSTHLDLAPSNPLML